MAEFHINKSEKGYRVQLYRHGEPYVTFLDGLTREKAEQAAERLRVFWKKIQPRSGTRSKPGLSPDQLLT